MCLLVAVLRVTGCHCQILLVIVFWEPLGHSLFSGTSRQAASSKAKSKAGSRSNRGIRAENDSISESIYTVMTTIMRNVVQTGVLQFLFEQDNKQV